MDEAAEKVALITAQLMPDVRSEGWADEMNEDSVVQVMEVAALVSYLWEIQSVFDSKKKKTRNSQARQIRPRRP